MRASAAWAAAGRFKTALASPPPILLLQVLPGRSLSSGPPPPSHSPHPAQDGPPAVSAHGAGRVAGHRLGCAPRRLGWWAAAALNRPGASLEPTLPSLQARPLSPPTAQAWRPAPPGEPCRSLCRPPAPPACRRCRRRRNSNARQPAASNLLDPRTHDSIPPRRPGLRAICTTYASQDACAKANGCEWNATSAACAPSRSWAELICHTYDRAACETITIKTEDQENGALVGCRKVLVVGGRAWRCHLALRVGTNCSAPTGCPPSPARPPPCRPALGLQSPSAAAQHPAPRPPPHLRPYLALTAPSRSRPACSSRCPSRAARTGPAAVRLTGPSATAWCAGVARFEGQVCDGGGGRAAPADIPACCPAGPSPTLPYAASPSSAGRQRVV